MRGLCEFRIGYAYLSTKLHQEQFPTSRVHRIDISFGGEIGNARVELSDFTEIQEGENIGRNVQQNCEGVSFETDYVVASDLTNLHCNETAIIVNEVLECKIEVNDDFNDKYCKEEHDDSVHSPELQEDVNSADRDDMETHSSNKRYKCKKCKSSLKTERSLKRHVLGHKREYKCKTCGKCFSHLYAQQNHSMVHTGEKPHRCETCEKRFTHLDYLKKHKLIHAGGKHKCEKCGKCFPFMNGFKRHALIHTGEKPHSCETCGKGFALMGSLKRHVLIHTGERPHECKTCGKGFPLRSTLKTHMVVHSGEKLHECKTCRQRFTLLGNLKKHVMIHTGEKPYGCDVCGKSYRFAAHLRRYKPAHDKPG